MLVLIAKRLLSMLLIMAVISLVLFLIFETDKLGLARQVLGPYTQEFQLEAWLEDNGYNRPFFTRYVEWVGNALTGDFGISTRYKTDVGPILWERLGNTAILAAWVFALMIPISLALGVLAGMREGSLLDRGISIFSVVTTSIPEFAMATFLLVIFVTGLGFTSWFPANFNDGIGFQDLVLPVATLVIYDMGYVARMTRASMAEVMQSQYIRTAILKGVSFPKVVTRHALRNALIAPFTIIVLQLNWLLSGVIVVEFFFNYKGFGLLLYEAALAKDIFMIEACTMVAVVVAVGSQIISDIGYMFLNPRIRFS